MDTIKKNITVDEKVVEGLKSGNIYLVKIQIENSNNIIKNRPVILLENIDKDKIKVIPLSSNTNNATEKIKLNLLLKDRVSYVTLLSNKIMIIPKSAIITQIGSVSDNVMAQIKHMLLPSDTKESKTDSNIQDDIIIYKEYIEDMKDYTINSNQILKKLISRKTTICNIIVAISTGIIASLLTNFIWKYIK